MFSTYQRLDVHVGDSNRTVIRAARRRLKPFRQDQREARKAFYREMLEHHAKALGLFLYVCRP
jgi:hypothetical protein